MIDIIGEIWNPLLTLYAALISSFALYYRVKQYRARLPNPDIDEIDEAEYYPCNKDEYGDWRRCEEEEANSTRYNIEVRTKNTGSSRTTIKRTRLILEDTSEEFENGKQYIDGNDFARTIIWGVGEKRSNYPDKIQGTLRVETTNGTLERRIELALRS